jgi:hypothetical protein
MNFTNVYAAEIVLALPITAGFLFAWAASGRGAQHNRVGIGWRHRLLSTTNAHPVMLNFVQLLIYRRKPHVEPL